MGIIVRHLKPIEMTDRTHGRLVYVDFPREKRFWDELEERDFAVIAADRLPGKITGEVVKAKQFVYAKGKDASAPTVSAQTKVVQKQLADAWEKFNDPDRLKTSKSQGEFDPAEFRMYLEAYGKYRDARIAMDRTRNVGKYLEVLGLTPIQVKHCKSILIQGMLPPAGSTPLTIDQLTKTVFTLTPATPVAEAQAMPAAYLLNGRMESGNIRVDGGASN